MLRFRFGGGACVVGDAGGHDDDDGDGHIDGQGDAGAPAFGC